MKTFTIGQVAEKIGVTVETIRYYEHEDLIPPVRRDEGGRRVFTDDDINHIRLVIEMKKADVPLKDIAYFASWRGDGDDSLEARYEFLEKHELTLEAEIKQLEKSLAFLHYKKWYYKTAIEAGTENIHLLDGTLEVSEDTLNEYAQLLKNSDAKTLGKR
ncbi:MerR family transcriptional regulator [Paucilactobacillus nenjiangensis]|uniref:MerR family transcriptional regulator n=1 Tax=Paucilactobacillus nenjiangensis TaxID=1296540 RepID=UPI0028D34EA9|nr:MerR family transcriptional regulator [Paucilactobacillus nenjiangensis]